MLLASFLSAEPIPLARPDKDSMPQQILMEILVGDFDDKKCFREKEGEFQDITLWDVVMFNKQGEVDSIDWAAELQFDEDYNADGPVGTGGSIDLQWIPSSVTSFTASRLHLTGTIDTTSLPRELTFFFFGVNRMNGTFHTMGHPRKLCRVSVAENRLSANPTKGHLSVVGWTSTPVFGEAKNLFKPLVVFLSWRRPY